MGLMDEAAREQADLGGGGETNLGGGGENNLGGGDDARARGQTDEEEHVVDADAGHTSFSSRIRYP